MIYTCTHIHIYVHIYRDMSIGIDHENTWEPWERKIVLMKEVDNGMNMTCKRNGTIKSGVISVDKMDRG